MASKLDQVMRGRVWKFGDSIDTNQLAGVPGARNMEDYKRGCLAGLRPEFPEQAKPGDILVAGTNFACGSSRQTAVEVLIYMGIQAVLAESIAKIHFRSSMALALPTFFAPGITGIVEDGQELEVDYPAGVARNPATGAEVKLRKYPPTVERLFELGGISQLIAERLKEEGVTP